MQQYYHILHSSPDLVHRFYQETSKLGRPEANGVMASVTSTEVRSLVKLIFILDLTGD